MKRHERSTDSWVVLLVDSWNLNRQRHTSYEQYARLHRGDIDYVLTFSGRDGQNVWVRWPGIGGNHS